MMSTLILKNSKQEEFCIQSKIFTPDFVAGIVYYKNTIVHYKNTSNSEKLPFNINEIVTIVAEEKTIEYIVTNLREVKFLDEKLFVCFILRSPKIVEELKDDPNFELTQQTANIQLQDIFSLSTFSFRKSNNVNTDI